MHFKRRRSMEDGVQFGRSSTSVVSETVEEACRLVEEDQWRTMHNIADIVGFSYASVLVILTSELRHVAVKLAPCLLILEQKEHQMQVCEYLHQRATDEPTVVWRIITWDKAWFCDHGMTQRQSSNHSSRRAYHPTAIKVSTLASCLFCPGQNCQLIILLKREHSMKAVGYEACEEPDSPQWQCSLSTNTPGL